MIKKKAEKKDPKKNELVETKNLLLRVQADFENYKKRTQRERESFGDYLNSDLILRIIPTLDNFRLALKHLPKELEGNEWVKGIWHIEKQLEQTLSEEGIREIESTGQDFNPNLHEAIEEVESDMPPGQITEEILKGYMLKEKILRHSKVRVSKGNNKNNINKADNQ
jgi:molecular chaperone GrpE